MSTSEEAPSSSSEVSGRTDQNESPVLYGHLVLLGYNGALSGGNRGRKRSKYEVYQRSAIDCAKYKIQFVVSVAEAAASNRRSTQKITRVVECEVGEGNDMFQIGRSAENANHFVVVDKLPTDYISRNGVFQSSVSRFACRILASRSNLNIVRIYAGGFDPSRKLLLGEKTIKLKRDNSTCFDGLTTNGVLICHPRGSFSGGEAKAGLWHEVTVCGDILALRRSRSDDRPGSPAEYESNILRDGSLIDLCGVTLLWRSAEGLKVSPTSHTLEALVEELNAGRPQCPVGRNTLVLPRNRAGAGTRGEDGRHAPYVYLKCGHVQGPHAWGREGGAASRRCPMCLEVSPAIKLCLGSEPAFYVDAGQLTHAFNPCGHVATEKTVKYWSSMPVPQGSNGFDAICPFCGAILTGSPGYIRLIFQDNSD